MSGKIGSTARSLFRLAWTVKTEAEVSRFITRVEESMSEHQSLVENAIKVRSS
ncbi:hypothetical protein E4U23_001954 [Claviceps purpurea]|nr:hypothetical protein E4U23_001954 [Claviceps purpurea]